MKKHTYIIVSDRSWNRDLAERLSKRCDGHFVLIDRRDRLTPERLGKERPRYIFFPHWSYRIPASIYEQHECVVFHMTDVPYGRGGTPLQNLIVRGHTETVVSALQCAEEIDAGPVYLKHPLSLHGSAEEIFLRASNVIEDMIAEIIERQPIPVAQRGEPVVFQRRNKTQGDLRQARSLDAAYDLIRMLDAEGYPPAFVRVGDFQLEFKRANRRAGSIHADVVIKKVDSQ